MRQMILPKLLGCQKQNCQYIIVYKVLYGKCEQGLKKMKISACPKF